MNKISVIIPVYNEEKFLEKSIEKIITRIEKNKKFIPAYEILLIENGSNDKSFQIGKRLEKRYQFIKTFHLNYASYGQAIKMGILKAKNKIIIIFNVDFWNINFLKKGLKLINGSDIIVGSKTLIPSKDQRPQYRRLTTYFFNFILKMVFNFPGTDTHGLKIMKKNKILPLARKCVTCNELFDTELILRACKEKLILIEIPIDIKETRPSRYNNLKRFGNIIKDLYLIFRIKYLNGFYYHR